ncbi:MAG: hypothetical protein IPJ38_13735 [Dechloromonas sp.]|uniref:Uncharacterized protein n=1 Tax=Candidatus Dechloromonas phosphorivorans TaxID=2899244 RepID=A0A935MRI1_9RHOO|nr:hypothetical protein [Candidatus Dechloromonas phosphorivorans]
MELILYHSIQQIKACSGLARRLLLRGANGRLTAAQAAIPQRPSTAIKSTPA